MPFEHEVKSEPVSGNPEHHDNWQSLGMLRRRLMRDACLRGAAISEARGNYAEAAYRRQMAEGWE